MADHAELRRLAEKATPGPWQDATCDDEMFRSADCIIQRETGNVVLFYEDDHLPIPSIEDTHYIAAANPSTVNGLLDENERLTKNLKRAEEVLLDHEQEIGEFLNEMRREINPNGSGEEDNATEGEVVRGIRKLNSEIAELEGAHSQLALEHIELERTIRRLQEDAAPAFQAIEGELKDLRTRVIDIRAIVNRYHPALDTDIDDEADEDEEA